MPNQSSLRMKNDTLSQRSGFDGAGMGTAPKKEPAFASNPMFELIICETQTAAVMCAVVTSGVNVFAKKDALKIGCELRKFMPADPSPVVATAARLNISTLTPSALSAVSEFFYLMAVAKAELSKCFLEAASHGWKKASVIHAIPLQSYWQTACSYALIALGQLDCQRSVVRGDLYEANSHALAQILIQVRNGGAPCLDSNDRLFLPELPQRRRHTRRALLQKCTVGHRGKTFHGLLKDISAGGIGLAHAPGLAVSNQIEVKLQSGRTLVAVVKWSNGMMAGAEFTSPLLPNDPLLSG